MWDRTRWEANMLQESVRRDTNKMKEDSEESRDTEDCSNVSWKFSFLKIQKTVILHLKIFHNIIMFSLQVIYLFLKIKCSLA